MASSTSFFKSSGTSATLQTSFTVSVAQAEAARDEAVIAKNASEAARDLSISAKDLSVSSKNTSVSAKDASIAAQGASESARDLALGYRDTAETHKDDAETAQTGATASATLAQNYAIKIDGAAAASNYSSKAWAVGGSGVTTTAGSGAAKEWATAASTGTVDGSEMSSKAYAIGDMNRGSTGAHSAKDWASYVDGNNTVDGTYKSAKKYAEEAASSASAASGTLSSFQAVFLGDGSSDPSSGHTAGDLFFNTAVNKLKYYDGTSWIAIEASGGAVATAGFAIAMATAL